MIGTVEPVKSVSITLNGSHCEIRWSAIAGGAGSSGTAGRFPVAAWPPLTYAL
jgi:hypothetical protein